MKWSLTGPARLVAYATQTYTQFIACQLLMFARANLTISLYGEARIKSTSHQRPINRQSREFDSIKPYMD